MKHFSRMKSTGRIKAYNLQDYMKCETGIAQTAYCAGDFHRTVVSVLVLDSSVS
jgi:hypothetical protein